MITEDYISFETAKLLKENGFDECTLLSYNKNGNSKDAMRPFLESEADVRKPTIQMAMKWLREVHKLYVVVRPYVTEDGIFSLFDVKSIKEKDIVVNIKTRTGFNSYEEACEAAIKYCLNNLI